MKAWRYRIYCEDVERARIERIVGNVFEAFTIIEAKGFWRGKSEHSLVIEIIERCRSHSIIAGVCNTIQTVCKQEAVLYTAETVNMNMITF